MYLCRRFWCKTKHEVRKWAPVAELVDALDLGSSVLRRAGSSPVRRTNDEKCAKKMRKSPKIGENGKKMKIFLKKIKNFLHN